MVARIDHRAVGTGSMGPVVRQLREIFFNIVRGRIAKYRLFCTPVYGTSPQAAATPEMPAGASVLRS